MLKRSGEGIFWVEKRVLRKRGLKSVVASAAALFYF